MPSRFSPLPGSGFHPSRRMLRLMDLCRRFDDMLMFYTVAAAVLLSMAALPAYAGPQRVETPGLAFWGQDREGKTKGCLIADGSAERRTAQDARVAAGPGQCPALS